MADRKRVRVGRAVTYFPTDAQAATGNGSAGDSWLATVTAVAQTGLVNLSVHEADGGFIALTGIAQSGRKGGFATVGGLAL